MTVKCSQYYSAASLLNYCTKQTKRYCEVLQCWQLRAPQIPCLTVRGKNKLTRAVGQVLCSISSPLVCKYPSKVSFIAAIGQTQTTQVNNHMGNTVDLRSKQLARPTMKNQFVEACESWTSKYSITADVLTWSILVYTVLIIFNSQTYGMCSICIWSVLANIVTEILISLMNCLL